MGEDRLNGLCSSYTQWEMDIQNDQVIDVC